MPGDNRTKMSLAPVRNTAEVGWHQISGPYDSGYIQKIVDPANVPLKRVLTAIPSPFARIHLFEAAFAFCKAQQDGGSDFHRMVSECLDVLELLHGLEDQAQKITIMPWNAAENLRGLLRSGEPGQKLLAETLQLFLRDDGTTANFAQQPVFYELIVHDEVLAVSSPLTLFFTSPRAGEIAERQHLIHPDTQRPYFQIIRPLHERSEDFQVYLHKLFLTPPAREQQPRLSRSCVQMFEYMGESIRLLEAARSPLANTLRSLHNGGMKLNQSGSHLLDKNNDPVQVLGFELFVGPSKQKQKLAESSIVLRSTFPVAGKPLVWTGLTDSYGVSQTTLLPAPANLPPLNERLLPDLGIRYPFLCAADFIEDRLVKVPFAANSNQFYQPVYEEFPKDLDQSFLLPLKQAFFHYFPPSAIPSMATFIRLPKGDGVRFELKIPIKSKTLLFERSYYNSPQGEGRGKIVSAAMNLALFPFLSVAGRPQFSNRYWIMLVDDERGGVWETHDDVFEPTFFRLESGNLQPFDSSSEHAPLKVNKHVRSTKASKQAGSTYFHLTGNRCDLIQIAAFGTDSERRGTGMVAPAWFERQPGTHEARIAIDFGTTNTHMALRLESADPVPFTVEAAARQVALLSSEDYNDRPSQIPGTEARLFHEFIPSLIGPASRFHFPLRSATSEQPNLVARGFKPLQSVNISFTHGIETPLPSERISTRLKWSVDGDPLVAERIEAFVEELLLLMRTKLLLLDVDLEKVILTWFRPMSFTRAARSRFDEIWQRKCEEILGMPRGRVTSLTESEAPFYYHHKRGAVMFSAHTVCVDIGGGSTDIVFFHQDKPRFGTSFTFAGNELWGNGYAEVEQGETGIVSRLLDELGKLLEGTPGMLSSTFAAMKGSKASSVEIMNFCFGVDAQIGVSKFLSDKSSVKCLALIHYAAILYHCAQLMKGNGMDAPEILCFSGRGSKYLDILERNPEKRYTSAIGKAIFEHVYAQPITAEVSLQFARDGKEATCNGGLLKELNLKSGAVPYEESLPSMPNIGDGSTPTEEPPLTGQIDNVMIAAVAANYRNFVEMLVSLSTRREIHFKDCLEITFPPDLVRSVLTQKVEETIRRGVQSRQPHAAEDPISETLFFYPLVQNLFELGVKLS